MEPNQRAERPRAMRHIAAIALTAFATAGCIGSSSSASSGSSSAQSTTASTEPTHRRDDHVHRPDVPTRRTMRPGIQDAEVLHREPTTHMLTRRRQHGDTDAACQALSDVVTKLGKKHWVCGCAAKGRRVHPSEGSRLLRRQAADDPSRWLLALQPARSRSRRRAAVAGHPRIGTRKTSHATMNRPAALSRSP